MIAVATVDGRILAANSALTRTLGYGSDELGAMGVLDLHPADKREEAQAVFAAILRGERHDCPLPMAAKSGALVPVETRLWPGRWGSEDCLFGVSKNLTAEREAQQRFERLFRSNPNLMALSEFPVRRFVDVNDAFLKALGFSAQEVLGRTAAELKLFPDAEQKDALSAQLQAAGRFADLELQVRRKDGTLLTGLFSGELIQSQGKQHFLTAMVDITERKRVESELHESRQRLRLALDSAAMGVWHWDIVSDARRFDEQTCRLLGIDPSRFSGAAEEFFDAVHPDDRVAVRAALARAIEEGAPYALEYRALWRDGSVHALAARGRVLRDGEATAVRIDGVLWDETERVAARQALSESEERFRQLAEAFPETIFEADLSANITYSNVRGLQMFGLTPTDLEKGLHVIDLIAFEDQAKVMDRLRVRLEGAPRELLECRARRLDGAEFHALAFTSPIFQRGTRVGFRGFVMDITERKRAEQELRESNRQLELATAHANDMAERAERASAAKSEFLANMSHEIRTPMNGVIGMTGLLLDTDLDSEQRRYAETARASAEVLLALVNDILDFSKIEAGKLSLETLDFDLGALLDDFAAMMAPRSEQKRLELLCALAPEVPALLRGDPGRLRQVLTNLLGNAIKFTSQGEVAVRVDVASETARDVVLRFSVRDTGIGIPADKRGMLFQKFTQVDASVTRRYGGTGLGLAISKQLAELMGGEIGVDSREGVGSEFWFTARLEKQPAARPAPVAMPAGMAGARILVVDDNRASRELLQGQLARWGARPSQADDGPSALRLLRGAVDAGDPFLVVLVDQRMPGMDGESLGRAVAEEERLAGTRRVLMASPVAPAERAGLASGEFCARLLKPVRPSELLGCLAAALGSGAPGAAGELAKFAPRGRPRVGLRVLVAEDNFTNQQVALGLLGKLGVRADAVANGREALESLRRIPYDLVLMDVQMPEVDGFAATREIRAGGAPNPAIPIVAVTAHAMQGDREDCLKAGMDDYLPKPMSAEALARMIEKWAAHVQGAAAAGREPPADSAAPSPGGAGATVFDEASLLERVMGDRALAQEIARGFLDDAPRQISALRGHLGQQDAPAVRLQAHALKGASAVVGGGRLVSRALEMERAGAAGDLDAARGVFDDLQREFERLKRGMEASVLVDASKEKGL